MKKRRAIRNFVFIGIVLLLLLILTASSFTIPFTDYKFNGFVGGLNRSVDLNGGISATYKVSTADYFEGSIDDARNKAIDRINYLIAKYYGDGRVNKVGDDKINITIADTQISSNLTVGMIEMKEKAGEPTDGELVITGQHIKKVYYKNVNNQNGVVIEFNKQGTELYRQLTSKLASSSTSGGTMYIYINKDYDNAFTQLTVSQEDNSGLMYLSSESMTTKKTTEVYCEKLKSCMLGINMTQDGVAYEVSPIMGKATQYIILGVAIALIVGLFATLICLYRYLGLLACVSLIFNIMLPLVFVPVFDIQFSLVSAFGYMFAFILATIMHLVIMEQIRINYAGGKKLFASIKAGYKTGLFVNLYIMAVVGVPSILLAIICPGVVRSLCANIVFGLIVSAFTSLVVFRALIANYNAFNSTKGRKFNFKQEVQDVK